MRYDACISKLAEAEKDALLEAAETRTFQSDSVVIKEGDKVNDFLILRGGMLRVTQRRGQSLSAEFAAPLGPGNAVGEMSFVDGVGASATLIADGDVELLVVSRSVIESFIEKDPSFAGRFYQSLFIELANKLRHTNVRVLPAET